MSRRAPGGTDSKAIYDRNGGYGAPSSVGHLLEAISGGWLALPPMLVSSSAGKDIGYYSNMTEVLGFPSLMPAGTKQALSLANSDRRRARMVLEIVDFFADLFAANRSALMLCRRCWNRSHKRAL